MRRWTFLWINWRCITFLSLTHSCTLLLARWLILMHGPSQWVPFFCVLISCARFTFRFIIRFDWVCSLLLYLFRALLAKDLPFASSSASWLCRCTEKELHKSLRTKTKFSKLCVCVARTLDFECDSKLSRWNSQKYHLQQKAKFLFME